MRNQIVLKAERRSGGFDYVLLAGLLALSVLGDIMIYSATKVPLTNAGYDPYYYFKRQTIWVVVGAIVMFGVSRIDHQRFEIIATPSYIGIVGALMGVFIAGSSSLGATRWFNLGFVQIQPSEFAVLVLILTSAAYSARRPEGLVKRDIYRILTMVGLPVGLIFLQPDLGTSIIILVTVSVIIVIAGVPPRFMAVLGVGGVVLTVAATYVGIFQTYQIHRLTSFLSQQSTNSQIVQLIYQVSNAKHAIGAGGLWGSGLFGGLQTTMGWVPEQRTDFIFTAIGEQLGFLGSTAVLLILLLVGYRIYRTSREAKDQLGRLIAAGVFTFFAFSCFQNIGMTMGIMPVTGIPLPFVSYGGSACLVFSVAAGAVLSVSRRRGS